DDPMIGASIRRGLRQDGFAVDWVEDGRAAEQALSEDVHDVLVLDVGLPKRSGLDVLAAMRRRGDTRPVLVLTARASGADRAAGAIRSRAMRSRFISTRCARSLARSSSATSAAWAGWWRGPLRYERRRAGRERRPRFWGQRSRESGKRGGPMTSIRRQLLFWL